uniref:DNA-directed RNA polymerase n=1 Tax=viral metagenome TaxID=1070528 RepID=A0A6C0ATZ4_9ZZZZ|tara:strand:- start:41868 stop:42554 length:687 start_codon:yes stop_codon:yes gene_type:complete
MDANVFTNEILDTEEMNETEQKQKSQYVDDDLYGDSDEDTVPPPPDDNDNEDDVDIDMDDEDVGELNEEEIFAPLNRTQTENENTNIASNLIDNLSDDEDEDEDYLQKIDDDLHNHFLQSFHPELLQHNYEEVAALTKVTRNTEGIIIDPLHRTLPFITRYERAKILGERASQLEAGAKPMVKVEPNVLDGYLIALKEFEEKKIPFIVKRPLPNGSCEYWKLQDLEII